MSKKIDELHAPLEWESMQWPLSIYYLKALNGNYKLSEDSVLTITRNEAFDLEATLSGTMGDQNDLEYKLAGQDPKSGNFIQGDIVEGTDLPGSREYLVKSFLIGSTTAQLVINSMSSKAFRAKVLMSHVEEKWTGHTPAIVSILEFYLTGKLSILFPQTTKRRKANLHSKTRHGIDPEPSDPENVVWALSGSSRDCLVIESPDVKLVVQRVDNSLLPSWANGIQIEYRQNFKGIPDLETRKGISEIVSFIFGTHLLKVGESHFDNGENIVGRASQNPWGDNVVSKSRSSAHPPISFPNSDDWRKIERVLNKVVPTYLALRSELGLSDVLWKYWIAKELAVGTNLPILSSALETLSENFVRKRNVAKVYSESDKATYSALIEEELTSLNAKLAPYQFASSILNKLQNPFNLGTGEKLRLFFSAIGIKFGNGSVENQALRARNKMTHSSIEGSNDQEAIKYVRLTTAYITLFNRSLLRVLGYEEKYIDYYSVGHPERNMNENIEDAR